MGPDNTRTVKLKKHFDDIINGHLSLDVKNSVRFLEAIYTQADAVACVEKLRQSDKGLLLLQKAIQLSLSPTFFNGCGASLLRYISSPDLASIGGGTLLQQVVFKIVELPTFWTPFLEAFKACKLRDDAQFCFAWLLLQLLLLPDKPRYSPHEIAKDPAILDPLLSSPSAEVRTVAQKIKHVVASGITASVDLEYCPGGRHDNDSADFRRISILPTADELLCKEKPFLRQSACLDELESSEDRIAVHFDNQFRLLREDMLYEMREELHIALGLKKGKRYGFVLNGLILQDQYYEVNGKTCKWGLSVQLRDDLWQFKKDKPVDREAYLRDNKKIFSHQSMACLVIEDEIVAFPTINRDEALLARRPPIVVLQLEDKKCIAKVLLRLARRPKNVKLISIDTAIFSYEPILKALQEKQGLPLAPELLSWVEGSTLESPPLQSDSRIFQRGNLNRPYFCDLDPPVRIRDCPGKIIEAIEAIEASPTQNLQKLVNTPRPVMLDAAQAESLLSGLKQRVSLILGPPGTGKSFIGALLAKVLHNFTTKTILVVCYTNHALDQFLDDLLNIGIPESRIVRLGAKSTPRTENLALHKQKAGFLHHWDEIENLKSRSGCLTQRLDHSFLIYQRFNPHYDRVLQHLRSAHREYFEAFRTPQSNDGMQVVGKKGGVLKKHYLLDRWVSGKGAGIFANEASVRKALEIWKLPHVARRKQMAQWKEEMRKEHINNFSELVYRFNECQSSLDRVFAEKDVAVLRSKRIIACTTTGAAKYRDSIKKALPQVLLVEEAGEILESHILTALGTETKHLILIGDHLQLRPKVNNYLLTVEKGEGFDLNRSLFERLILAGYPHNTLKEQHRMRPEISALVRHLTYPDLVDAPKTHGRPDVRGLRDNFVFINHDSLEDDDSELNERRDWNAKSSKQNKFEVEMVLKIVRYLAQQGYGTDDIVVLTPYLGQLRKLLDALKTDNDPVLSELDTHDLIRAGLAPASIGKQDKKRLRISTIDNYQGEECDIVIVSLTRSNEMHEIGFMSSPERLNVLLSRARNALILIGNADTFMKARKGSGAWIKLFEFLLKNDHVYNGFPVKCERHQDRTALLTCGVDFDKKCPDGGCSEPCGDLLNCGHPCPSRCHRLSDHSNMPCERFLYSGCPNGHRQKWKCSVGPPASCTKCDDEKKRAAEKLQMESMLLEKRDAEERSHAEEMAQIQGEIDQAKKTSEEEPSGCALGK